MLRDERSRSLYAWKLYECKESKICHSFFYFYLVILRVEHSHKHSASVKRSTRGWVSLSLHAVHAILGLRGDVFNSSLTFPHFSPAPSPAIKVSSARRGGSKPAARWETNDGATKVGQDEFTCRVAFRRRLAGNTSALTHGGMLGFWEWNFPDFNCGSFPRKEDSEERRN